MSLSCVGVGEIVSVYGYCCRPLMSSFWGLERTSFWRILWRRMLGALNWHLGMNCSDACDVSFSLFSQKVPNFTVKGGFEVCHWRKSPMEILAMSIEGSLPWRFKHC